MQVFKLLLPFLLYAGITKIEYDRTGGRGGHKEHLEITKTSIVYSEDFSKGEIGNVRTVTGKNKASIWKKLINSINISNFSKIKSNPGHTLYDGIDVTITITSNSKQYSIVNGNEDSVNYKRIKPFTDQLESMLSDLRKK